MSVCEDVRESLSAVVDGERPPLSDVSAHLDGCDDCRRFAERLPGLARRTRLSDPGVVPDLRSQILGALAHRRAAPAGPAPRRDPVRDPRQHRAVAALAGVAQLAVAVPTLVGAGDAGHLAHDLAAFEIALAAVFLLAAWRPVHAGALAMVTTAFAAVGVLAAVGAVLDGGAVVGEVTHLVPVVGAAVLWSFAPPGRGPAGGSGAATVAGRR